MWARAGAQKAYAFSEAAGTQASSSSFFRPEESRLFSDLNQCLSGLESVRMLNIHKHKHKHKHVHVHVHTYTHIPML